MRSFKILLALFIFHFILFVSFPALAAAKKLSDFSLEELMATEVTSVSRKAQPLSQSAAAVYVISQEQIRRSTATKVPELLRMVPGIHVAQISASQWAITARGFNGALANKLLVMIDGRTVYTPLFAGVYWDVQDLVMEDIERIEVIRGPGASVWGANAVNGVINIITKSAATTQGFLGKGWGGSEEQGGAARFGGKFNDRAHYRAYGKFFNVDSSHLGNDAWYVGRGGFRSDVKVDEENDVTVQGDYYNGNKDGRFTQTNSTAPFTRTLFDETWVTGGNVLSRWNHHYSETSDSSLQMYFDHTYRDDPTFDEIRYTGDIDWQHRFLVGTTNEVVWGAGFRFMADETEGSFGAYFDPGSRIDDLYHLFAQDTLTILHNLWFTLGTKLEINNYTGFEIQPTARLLWQPHDRHSFWAAISRAVRTPSRLDQDLSLNAWLSPGAALARVEGFSGKDSETLIAYELGYRVQPHDRLTFDIAGFVNDYSKLTTLEFYDTFAENNYRVDRYLLGQNADALTIGTEIAGKLRTADFLEMDFGYTFLNMFVNSDNEPFSGAEAQQDQNPEHQLYFGPVADLPYGLQLAAQIRYVDKLKNLRVQAYWEMDLKLAWQATKNLELSLVGQNLFDDHHREFTRATEVQRAVYGKAVVEFD